MANARVMRAFLVLLLTALTKAELTQLVIGEEIIVSYNGHEVQFVIHEFSGGERPCERSSGIFNEILFTRLVVGVSDYTLTDIRT